MTEPKTSIYYRAYNPLVQATGIFFLGILVSLLAKLINALGILEIGNRFPWMSAAAFLLFFALINSLSSLSAEDLNKYWGRSMLAFAALAVASGLTAYGLSSLSINEAGSYRWIFIVLTFGYLVFLSIIGLMKNIVEFAEREDWQSPKKKKNK
ncbi:MAG: hypothetical protein AAFW73_12400 [Bacteroidota bacterium]